MDTWGKLPVSGGLVGDSSLSHQHGRPPFVFALCEGSAGGIVPSRPRNALCIVLARNGLMAGSQSGAPLAPEHPPEPPSTVTPQERRCHDLNTTMTSLRLRTQSLQRLAHRQDGDGWQRMATGLAAIDADLSKLQRQITYHDAE